MNKISKLDFSFSGLKTALLYKKKALDQCNEKYKLSDLAASYQYIIIESLISKIERSLINYDIKDIVIVGGVSANKYFREKANILTNKHNLNLKFPDFEYCTDNAAMIAMVGYLKYKNNMFSKLDIQPNPNIVYK